MLNGRGMDRKNPSNDNISGAEVSRRKSARFRRSAALRNDRQSLRQPLRTSSPLQPSLLIPIAVVGISLLISHDAQGRQSEYAMVVLASNRYLLQISRQACLLAVAKA